MRAFHSGQVDQIVADLTALGADVGRDPRNGILSINGALTVCISIASCRYSLRGESRWTIRFDSSLNPDITIAVRMAPGNIAILDYYVFPNIDAISAQCNLAEVNGMVLDVYRTPSLTQFFNLYRTQPHGEAA